MAQIANRRLKWQILAPELAEFRECYSIKDQIIYLFQTTEDDFQEKKHGVTLWVDVKQAFDKVWKEGLAVKVKRYGILEIWNGYTHIYTIEEPWSDLKSCTKVLLCEEVPQGGGISPSIFLVYINNLVNPAES